MKTLSQSLMLISLVMLMLQMSTFQLHSQEHPKQIVRDGVTYKLAPKPLYIDPVYSGSTDPMVCYNKNAKKWYMYYTSRRANVPGLHGIAAIHGSAIGIAVSEDGANWEYIGNCNIDYRPDEKPTYWAPEVIEHEGTYHMYLSYVPGIFEDWYHPRDMVHLTSKDGISWNYQSVLKLSSNRVIDACIMQLPNGIWRLWYNNENDGKSIYYAESPDLYNWTDKTKVKVKTRGEGPNVIFWHNKYYMIVDEWRGLSVYSSDDADNWTKQEEYLIAGIPFDKEEAAKKTEEGKKKYIRMIDGTKGNHADIELANDRAYMFYFSHIHDGKDNRITYVYAVELIYNEDGTISCDALAPCYINLNEK